MSNTAAYLHKSKMFLFNIITKYTKLFMDSSLSARNTYTNLNFYSSSGKRLAPNVHLIPL
jgi:hypothetical protein